MSAVTPGAVYCEEAYAQGKMLDHSSWFGKLPRRIRPSDVDFWIDNAGSLLACELSSTNATWDSLDIGQRRLYESLVRRGEIVAVLLKHSVPRNRKINTREDIDSFQPMFYEQNKIVIGQLWRGALWVRFVDSWFRGAAELRRNLAASSSTKKLPPVGYDQQPTSPTPEELKDRDYYRSPDLYIDKPQPIDSGRNRPKDLF